MEERGTPVADYFVVAGLSDNPEPVDDDLCEGLNPNCKDFEPITDITVIYPAYETVPKGFVCVDKTPSGYPANLNSGSLRSPEVYLCYRRGRDKPPLVDIGVMYDGKERLLPDAEVIISTPGGRDANVNNTSARTLLTFRRAQENMPCNELVVTDVCVIFTNKGEKQPHAFCVIPKNLNKGMMGCDVFLCYKKSMNRPPLLAYKPEVLMRLPLTDRRNCPFPSLAAMFCLPMCATIECWPKNALQPRPVFSTFVLTVADGTEKIYGAALTVYEAYPEEKLTQDQRVALGIVLPGDRKEKRVHVNKCICLLSHYPFFDAFRTFLCYLNWMVRNGSHDVPVERYIAHLLEEVPFPSPQRPHILMQLSPLKIFCCLIPTILRYPKASFRQMLINLGPDNCLLVLLLVLTEQKLLIHSLRPDVLTAVAEAVSVLNFPFRWICPYIPLCPLGLCAVLQAPVPFLVGVDSRFFDLYEPPNDVTCIDLDTTTISISEDRRSYMSVKLLPKKPAKILRQNLEHLKLVLENMAAMSRSAARNKSDSDMMDIDFQLKRKERLVEMEIQEAFLRFTTGILKGYRSYLLPITKAPTVGATDASSLFDFNAFLRSRDKNYHKFYQMMLKTQMFIRFIEERSFVSDSDASLEFFDECIDKMDADENENIKLVDYNESSQSERTVFVMPPEANGLPPNAKYSYNGIFQLNESLFGATKPKPDALSRLMKENDQSAPGSPIARRTKQEIKYSQKNAKKYAEHPHSWAKYLLSTCYSLWFIHLPSYVSVTTSKYMALCSAHEMLVRMTKLKIHPTDEVCYRVVMQLCGIYSQPLVAVKVLLEMKRCGITPNAITYGFYNKAVLEAQWPSNVNNPSQLMWNKLRNVIVGVAQFRAAGKQHHMRNRRQFSQSTDEVDRISTGSGASLDSQQNHLHGRGINAKANSPTTSSAMIAQGGINGKCQSDSETVSLPTTAVPTRISSSSDIGYGSMTEQKPPSETDGDDDADGPQQGNHVSSTNGQRSGKSAKFWGQMGRSLDQWVRSGASSLANVVQYAADTSYYTPASLMIAGYQPDYSQKGDYDYDDDDFDENSGNVKGPSRRLNFDDENEEGEKNTNTLRLLRSVSFGNDTQIMVKLKELKEDLIKEEKRKSQTRDDKTDGTEEAQASILRSNENGVGRAGSADSNGSLEGKVKQFYEPSNAEENKDRNLPKINGNSRDVTPFEDEDADDESYQNTIRPGDLAPPRSPSMHVKSDQISREATPCSPARTPITQNDPLGALSDPSSPMNPPAIPKKFPIVPNNKNISNVKQRSSIADLRMQSSDSPKRTCSEGQIDGYCIGPEGECLHNHNQGGNKAFHRSSTLPNYSTILGMNGGGMGGNGQDGQGLIDEKYTNGSAVPVVPSLSAISSNFKNPFGRYSPGRLSLRKAGTSFIESTIGGKKAEALMEGFNQFKSTATATMKNKIEELKEVVGNTNSPGQRNGPFGKNGDDYPTDLSDNEAAEPVVNEWASVSESYLDKLLTTEPASTRASFANSEVGFGLSHHDTPLSNSAQSLLMVDNPRAQNNPNRKEQARPIGLEIIMTTCSKCHSCNSLLFDEEIMAGWTAEDSNLNTRCPQCKKWAVPFMEVTLSDYRHIPLSQMFPLTSASSIESMNSAANMSRRTSVMNPPQSIQGKMKEDEIPEATSLMEESEMEKSGDLVPAAPVTVEEQADEIGEALKKDELTLDPLGVIEELQRSRRNSPDPNEANNKTPQTETKTEVSTSTAPASNFLNVQQTQSQPPQLQAPPVKVEGVLGDPILVPYLSPLVLRKELENVLDHEGDSCLVNPKFVDEHPIIFWNLVWFFHRANLTSHIKGLCLNAKSVLPNKKVPQRKDESSSSSMNINISEVDNKSEEKKEEEFVDFSVHPSWETADYRNVLVRCKWDNPKFHAEYDMPLYVLWAKNKEDNGKDDKEGQKALDNNLIKLMNNIIKTGNLGQICPQLLYHYHKQSQDRHFPTYRDVLFLTLVAAGRESVEAYGYGLDKEYRDVYSKLRCNDDFESMDIGDLPPSDAALFCRRYFKELEL